MLTPFLISPTALIISSLADSTVYKEGFSERLWIKIDFLDFIFFGNFTFNEFEYELNLWIWLGPNQNNIVHSTSTHPFKSAFLDISNFLWLALNGKIRRFFHHFKESNKINISKRLRRKWIY